MITGGSSYDGLTYGAFSGGYKPLRPDELSYDEYGGLGFLAGWLPDTHFSERGREARLIRFGFISKHVLDHQKFIPYFNAGYCKIHEIAI